MSQSQITEKTSSVVTNDNVESGVGVVERDANSFMKEMKSNRNLEGKNDMGLSKTVILANCLFTLVCVGLNSAIFARGPSPTDDGTTTASALEANGGSVTAHKAGVSGEVLNPDCDLVHDKSYTAQCESWCTGFFDVCINPNLVSSVMGHDECVRQCASWPRSKTVATRPPSKFYHLHSDTFECRDLHLWEAQIGEDPNFAAFHCGHIFDPTDGICADALVDGKNPYVMMKEGACTYHHYGYCDLSNEDQVADCMKANIDDEQLPDVLAMLPPTVKILFLNENEGITRLESGIFQNLANPLGLKALYLDDCNITTVDEDVFHPLQNLNILNLNFNWISEIQDDLLMLPELKQFSMYGDPTAPGPPFGPTGGRKPGQLTSAGFSNRIFQHTPNLERLTVYGHFGVDSLPAGLFEGLSKVESMYWVFCSLTNEGIPEGLWEPLVSLRHFDMQGNAFTELDPAWLGPWFSNIERILLFNIGPNTMDLAPFTDTTMFDNMPKLKILLMENNARLRRVGPEFFTNNPELHSLSL